jgi:hypothetical protein
VSDVIERIVELLETAHAEQDWELVLDAIRLLNEIPNGNSPCGEDGEESSDNY